MGWTTRVQFPAGAMRDYLSSPPRPLQTSSGGHPASYPMGMALTSGVKLPGHEAVHSPSSNTKVTCVQQHLHSTNMSSWHGASLSKRCVSGVLLS